MWKNIYYCFCRNTQKFVNEPTMKTPLLSPDRKPGSSEAVINQPVQVPVTDNGHYHGSSNDEGKPTKKGSGRPRKVSVGFTNVKTVDKRLQDHKKLYNEYYQKYEDLQSFYTDLCNAFDDENTEKTLERTFRLLRQKTRECESVTVSRKPQYGYTRVEFEPREVPNEVLVLFNKFNSANKLIKELTEKGPKLIDSVQLVLKDETDLRRDVLAASMGTEGPECMKMCIGGISELRKVPGFVEEILKRCKKIHKRGQRAVQLLIQDDETAESSDVIIKVHTSGTSSSSAEEKDRNPSKPLVEIENETEPKTKDKTPQDDMNASENNGTEDELASKTISDESNEERGREQSPEEIQKEPAEERNSEQRPEEPREEATEEAQDQQPPTSPASPGEQNPEPEAREGEENTQSEETTQPVQTEQDSTTEESSKQTNQETTE